MSSVKETFALIIGENRAVFFQQQKTGWQPLTLSGESGWLKTEKRSGDSPGKRLHALSERLNSEQQLADYAILIVCSASSYGYLPALAKTFEALKCRQWQLLQLEQLCTRAQAVQPGDLDSLSWLAETLLPVAALPIQTTTDAGDTIEAAADGAIDGAIDGAGYRDPEDLAQKIQQLQREKSELRASLCATLQPDTELLLSFLPAIYESFWSSISPADFALLTGQVTVPNIPSPFPEPSADTVYTLKRRFTHLPVAEREKIVGWCRSLSHAVKVRPVFRDMILEDVI